MNSSNLLAVLEFRVKGNFIMGRFIIGGVLAFVLTTAAFTVGFYYIQPDLNVDDISESGIETEINPLSN